MPAYTWRRGFTDGQSSSRDGDQWVERWNVHGYTEPSNGLALADLQADQPTLRPGQPHPVVTAAYVDTFTPDRHGSAEGWGVSVAYKIDPGRQPDTSPLTRPAEISLESELIEAPTFRRVDGTLIVNTAGDLIHGLTRKVPLRVFNFEKNVAAIPAWLQDYSDLATNSDAVTIEGTTYEPGYLQLQKVRGTPYQSEMVNGVPVSFRVLTFALVYNPLGWDQKVFNRGLRQKVGDGFLSTIRVEWIMDENEDGERTPTDEPKFLDADGKALPLPINAADVIELDGVGVTSVPFNFILPLT